MHVSTTGLSAPQFESRGPQAGRTINVVLTLRGLAIVAFVGFLLAGPVANDSDIIASIFAYALLAVIFVSVALTVAQSLRLRKTLRVSLHSPGEGATGEAVLSGEITRFLLRTSPVELAPLFVLTIQPEFQHAGLKPSIHRLTGSTGQDRLLTEWMSFPHRGDWSITRITAVLGDQFGFTQFRWEMHPNPAQVFRVEPPPGEPTQLPIISSCQRPGDLYIAAHDRLGDPFDLKAYHPSDGLKKVVWKIFARTGELISRHPEHSMTPEGQVIVYCSANETDDVVCTAALSYARQLHDLDLELYFGCDGFSGLPVARSADEAREMLIETVWNPPEGSDDLQELLSKCGEQLVDSQIDKVIIFAAKSATNDESRFQHLLRLADLLESRRIEPIFYLIEPTAIPETASLGAITEIPARDRALRWFLDVPEERNRLTRSDGYRQFMALCSERDWEVFAA